MRWPRKGIVIRLFIYGPIIGYLGYQAAASRCEPKTPPNERTVTQPDGTEHRVLELSPEEAEHMLKTNRSLPSDDR